MTPPAQDHGRPPGGALSLPITSGTVSVTLSDAVRAGRRAGLEALRDDLAAAIEEADVREKAPLARQLTIVLEQLDSLPGAKETNPVDDLAAARAARRAAASAQ